MLLLLFQTRQVESASVTARATGLLAAQATRGAGDPVSGYAVARAQSLGLRGGLGSGLVSARSRSQATGLRGARDPARLSAQARTAILYTIASDFKTAALRAYLSGRLGSVSARGSLAVTRAALAARLAVPATETERVAVSRLDGFSWLGTPSTHRDAEARLFLRADLWTLVSTSEARSGEMALVAWAHLEVPGIAHISPSIPFSSINPINLGQVYRGDTIVMPIWQAIDAEGNILDLAEATLWFTAKVSLDALDEDPPTIQCSTKDGGVVILDAQSGLYRVTIHPPETQQLATDTAFTFDVQVETPALVKTIRWGDLVVVRDVTRTPA